jgi:hypothetical protein
VSRGEEQHATYVMPRLSYILNYPCPTTLFPIVGSEVTFHASPQEIPTNSTFRCTSLVWPHLHGFNTMCHLKRDQIDNLMFSPYVDPRFRNAALSAYFINDRQKPLNLIVPSFSLILAAIVSLGCALAWCW